MLDHNLGFLVGTLSRLPVPSICTIFFQFWGEKMTLGTEPQIAIIFLVLLLASSALRVFCSATFTIMSYKTLTIYGTLLLGL